MKLIICPVCGGSVKRIGNKIYCSKMHSFKFEKNVPVMAELNPYLEVEAKAWEDEWKKGVSRSSMRAYRKNMKIFKKLGFWEEAADAAKLIPSEKDYTVLDLGCGNGVSTANIKGKMVVGMDLSKNQMIKAKKKFPRTNYVVGDAMKLPFKSNTFDLVVAINLLHHIGNSQKVLREVFRVLKKGGKVLTVDPNLYNPIGFTGRELFKLLGLKEVFPTIPQFALGEEERQFTKDMYYRLFNSSPFRKFRIEPHRIERLLFFGSVLVPAISSVPFYEEALIFASRAGNALVHIQPLDHLCYFWKGEATK